MITHLISTLALGLMLAAPLASQGPRHPGQGRGHGPLLMWGLDLTEAQKASLKALAERHREAMKPKHEAAASAGRSLRAAMMDPATPAEQLKALHDKVSQARFELALDRRALRQESLALLTPEQKAKAEKLREEMQARRADHPRGPGAGHRRGMGWGEGPEPDCPGPAKK